MEEGRVEEETRTELSWETTRQVWVMAVLVGLHHLPPWGRLQTCERHCCAPDILLTGGLAGHKMSIEAGVDVVPLCVTAGGSCSPEYTVICQLAIPVELQLGLNCHVGMCQRLGSMPGCMVHIATM